MSISDRRRGKRLGLWCAFVCFGGIAHAADAPAPGPGTRVRLTLAGDATRLVGTLASADGRSLTVEPQGRDPVVVAREAILRFEESTKPSRKKRGAWIGFGIGLSASFAKVALQGGCNDGCNGANLLEGGLVAISTAALGALVSPGERWKDAPISGNAASPEEKSAFDLALAEAQRNSERPGGHAFEAAVGKHFGVAYGPRVSACAKRISKPDLRDVRLLVRLSMNGRVEEVLVRPETNLALCLRDELKGGSLPVPETQGYWVHIGMKFKR